MYNSDFCIGRILPCFPLLSFSLSIYLYPFHTLSLSLSLLSLMFIKLLLLLLNVIAIAIAFLCLSFSLSPFLSLYFFLYLFPLTSYLWVFSSLFILKRMEAYQLLFAQVRFGSIFQITLNNCCEY